MGRNIRRNSTNWKHRKPRWNNWRATSARAQSQNNLQTTKETGNKEEGSQKELPQWSLATLGTSGISSGAPCPRKGSLARNRRKYCNQVRVIAAKMLPSRDDSSCFDSSLVLYLSRYCLFLAIFFVRSIKLLFRRTTVQVKSHGQVMLRKQKKGINIFEPLDNPNCDDKTHPPPPMM